MTAIRSEIRRITRHGSPAFNCTVTVESVTRLSTGFRRVAVSGDGLAAYGDVLPAGARGWRGHDVAEHRPTR